MLFSIKWELFFCARTIVRIKENKITLPNLEDVDISQAITVIFAFVSVTGNLS
jgi:hypothetical protein